MSAKCYQNIHFIVWVSIQVKLTLLCGNILSACQYFKPKFFIFYHCIAFVNLYVFSLNVPVVSYLCIIMYDCVCTLYVSMYIADLAYKQY